MWNKILILEARGFGDAILKNEFIKELASQYPTTQIDVLTKKEFDLIFQLNAGISKVHFSEFPMGNFKIFHIISLMKMIFILRKERYDLCLDVVGDFREKIIVKLIGSGKSLSVDREKDHPFNYLIRRGFNHVNTIKISKKYINIYDQYKFILKYLGVEQKNVENKIDHKTINLPIGIHPFASQDCKMWGWKKWQELIGRILYKNYNIIIFCSPKEKTILYKNLGLIIENNQIKICSEALDVFFSELSKVGLLIGLDSFSLHASYMKKIPNIMLCGGNYYDTWKTPMTEVIIHSESCEYWPCFNMPKCKGRNMYKCMKNITVEEVEYKIELTLSKYKKYKND